MKTLLVFFTATLFFVSCQKDSPGDPAPLPAETQLNVSYGPDPLQKMDVYLPAGRSTGSTKVIVMIHGGGWTQGDKSEFTSYVDTLKRRLPGYAIYNINYRLANGTSNFFPTQENDVKTAVEFIYGKRNEAQISSFKQL
mgnify:FL=1